MRSTYHTPAFLGGEISPWAQGRSDLPTYKVSLNVCLNAVPVEEGAWTRRSGTMAIGPTFGRNYAKLLPFLGSPTCSFVMEFTDDNLRFVTQTFFNCSNDARTISSVTHANPGVITLDTTSGWTDGDIAYFVFGPTYSVSLQANWRNRPLTVGTPTGAVFTFEDDLGSPVDTTSFPTGALVGAAVLRTTRLSSPYAGDDVLAGLRAIQAEGPDGTPTSVILSGSVFPHVVTITTDATLTSDAIFTISTADFKDGPYLDPQLEADGTTETATVSAYTGSITFTDTGSSLTTFTSDDIGRHIRIFTQPADWASGTTYAYGALVTGPDGAWWQSLAQAPYASSNVGIPPGQIPPLASGVVVNLWAAVPDAGQWAWGKIASITSAHVVVVDLETDLLSVNGATVSAWQLGLFRTPKTNSKLVGFPICGTYHEGRLWLAGAAPNRFDGSMSNDIYTFSPTDIHGLVLDNSAIARTLNLPSLNYLYWMTPDQQGILCGMLSGEVLISASTLSDPLTTSSIQAHQVTSYGCSNIEPRRVGMAIAFVQRHQRRLIEYLSDSISGRFTGKHLNEYAKHLSSSGIAEIAYQEETVPIIWNRTNAGALVGVTYRRFSHFVTENPVVQGWHRHTHGRGALVESMCVIPGRDGLLDRLFLSTYKAGFGRMIEVVQPFFEVDDTIAEGWFLDQSLGPGPGNSGYDCGGGNPVDPTDFPTGGGPTGGDTVPDSGPTLPTPGTTIPAPGDPDRPAYFSVFTSAVYFDGTAALYDFTP